MKAMLSTRENGVFLLVKRCFPEGMLHVACNQLK